jgi:protein-S-isoprenylcysteine O-methyltransferase Ste14
MAEARDNSGVRFPPPLPYALGLLAGWWLQRTHPLPLLPKNVALAVGILLIVAGLAVARAGVRAVWKANSSIIPIRPTTAITSDGVFQFTRNPMYVGMVVIYVGIALLIHSAWSLILLPIVILAVDRLVIAKEERYLRSKFGETYTNYCSRVRRWI